MKVVSIKKKTLFKASGAIIFTMIVCIFTNSFSMQHYYNTGFSTGLVTATTLNVRSGPGTNYKIVTTVKKNEYIRVFAGIGQWYVIQTDQDYIGVVSKQYVKAVYPNSNSNSNSNNSSGSSSNTSTLSTDEKEVFDLINKQRTNNGLSALKMDSEALNVARIKAKEDLLPLRVSNPLLFAMYESLYCWLPIWRHSSTHLSTIRRAMRASTSAS